MTTTLKIISALIAFSAASPSTAFAEDCKALPAGPERAGCLRREHPEMFEAKLARCRQLASERGFTSQKGTGAAGGMKAFVQSCMAGKQH